MNAILLASAGVVVLLVGGGVGFWVGRNGIGGSKARVEKAEAELEAYKRNVTEHFGQTAAHFQAIGKQYRELYEHMAEGAQVLCEPDEAGAQLLFAPGTDPAPTPVKGPSTEAVAEAGDRAPTDYPDQPVATEAADVNEATAGPPDDKRAGMAGEAEGTETGRPDGPDSETAAESQPEARAEVDERTLH